jgi:hypothetical protein
MGKQMKARSILVVGALTLAGCQQGNGTASISSNIVTTPMKSQKLAFFTSLNADCSSLGKTEVRLISPPANGRVQIEFTNDFPNYRIGNQRYDCNKQRVPGTKVTFIPNPNFVGQDTIITEAFHPSGRAQRLTSNVTVR